MIKKIVGYTSLVIALGLFIRVISFPFGTPIWMPISCLISMFIFIGLCSVCLDDGYSI